VGTTSRSRRTGGNKGRGLSAGILGRLRRETALGSHETFLEGGRNLRPSGLGRDRRTGRPDDMCWSRGQVPEDSVRAGASGGGDTSSSIGCTRRSKETEF